MPLGLDYEYEMTAKKDSETHSAMPVSDRISAVGSSLNRSFRSLLSGLPGHPIAARETAETLNINKILVHKLLSALRSGDPLATAHAIPGPEPLMRVVKAAKAKGVSPDTVRAAEDAVSSFKNLISREAGDRSGLDAIISTLLPDARGRVETLAKQSVYRGIRQLKGFSADVTLMTFVMIPSESSEHCNGVALRGFFGLHCVRPGAEMKFSMITRVVNKEARRFALDGTPIGDPHKAVLSDFCSMQPANLQVHTKEGSIVYSLGWGNLAGPRSACDFVMAELYSRTLRRWYAPGDTATKSGLHDGVSVPTKTYLLDVILHEDVFPDWEPKVKIFEMGELGLASVNDESRDCNLMDLDVQIKPMGVGIERFRAKEVPNYIEILRYACAQLKTTPEKLRGFRARIDYAVFGTQVQIPFDLPLNPSAPRVNP